MSEPRDVLANAMARAFHRLNGGSIREANEAHYAVTDDQLAALRAEGWAVVRREDVKAALDLATGGGWDTLATHRLREAIR